MQRRVETASSRDLQRAWLPDPDVAGPDRCRRFALASHRFGRSAIPRGCLRQRKRRGLQPQRFFSGDGKKMSLKEYKPGTAFTGRMGRTVSESAPAWPAPYPVQPRRAEHPLHCPRRHRLWAVRLLWLTDQHTQPRPAGAERPSLHEHAHHGAVLAVAVLHAERAKPPLQRHGVHHRRVDGLPRLQWRGPVRERVVPRCSCHTGHRLRAVRLLWLADQHAQPGPAGAERASLHEHAHHGAVLAVAVVHAHRAQPPLQRHGVHHRGVDRLTRAPTVRSRSRTASCPRCCCRTATPRSASANGT